jgi:CPA2 family monovalent cation:H+ antiporter-2
MTDTHFLADTLIFLAAAVAAVALFGRVKVSPVVGYLVAGMIIGPHGFGFIGDVASVRALAELGVVFLLFSIGLELSLPRLKVMRGQVFGLGAAQVALSGSAIGIAAWWLGLDARAAIVVGAGLALSSTAIVLQLLSERGELTGRSGRTALAILLFQDLAVVLFLVLVPQLGRDSGSVLTAVGLAGVKALAALIAIVILGRLVLRPAFRVIAAYRLPELLIGLTLLVVLGISFATESVGLSLALGAFLAGLLLAETEFRHQVEADIQPFRGILLSLFFMTIGMNVELGLLVTKTAPLALLVVGLLGVKVLTIGGLCLAFRLPPGLALRQGIMLAESGEFAFILFGIALASGILDVGLARLLMLAVAITMLLAPALMALGRWAERRLTAEAGRLHQLHGETQDLRNHVVIAGYGRVGQVVAGVLSRRDVPWVALDLDPARVSAGMERGAPVFYGDSARGGVLQAAGAERARAVVVTLNDAAAAARLVALLRERLPNVALFVRGRDEAHCRELSRLGATAVVPEILEASLQLGARALKSAGIGDEDIVDVLAEMRAGGPTAPESKALDSES